MSFETWLVLFPLGGVVTVGTAFSDGSYSHFLLVAWQSCSVQVLRVGLGAVGVGLCLNSCCRFLSLLSVTLAFAVPLWAFIPVSLFSLQGPSGSCGNCASCDAQFLGPCVLVCFLLGSYLDEFCHYGSCVFLARSLALALVLALPWHASSWFMHLASALGFW